MPEELMNIERSHQGWASYKFQESCWEPIQIYFSTRELLVLESCSCCLATNIRLYWAQENNVQRLSVSHVCFFHMENELINKTLIFLPFFLVLGIPSGFLEVFAALFLLRGSKLNEDRQGMSFPFMFQAFTLVAQGQSLTAVSKSLQHNVTCVI